MKEKAEKDEIFVETRCDENKVNTLLKEYEREIESRCRMETAREISSSKVNEKC